MTITEITSDEITRDNAHDVQDRLDREGAELFERFARSTDLEERVAICRRAAQVCELLAIAWERGPGRTRDKQGPARSCRIEAQTLGAVAEIDQARSMTQPRLPDPEVIVSNLRPGYAGYDEALEAVCQLYAAACQAR